ncbi:dihydrolipoyl dehydrogenase [Ruixingdingia sedimenti]|uniref:Dihydrolipoyl dehydrogenase n=1 Tax=Ruixingdingia sedimenti TaxID=3073604 RepID=A0ABU1F3N8_9RHOB|nr:dihydrolipoyl dehydrogenase [Xinfangfangia sp. LG-4]MDR5651472.1 dihydrolipoyl dehydrogenase [Xinfangfangia sp. LG-4]
MKIDVEIPDIGSFSDVPVVEVLVRPGDRVTADTPILMLESDKATLDVPAPRAGVVAEVLVRPGDRVSRGDVVMVLDGAEAAPAAAPPPEGAMQADLLVIGGGPGGYTAAFRAADLGRQVVLVDRGETLGGVCLNVGCIPSKALLHVAKVIEDAADMGAHGLSFGAPQVDLDGIRGYKAGVVGRLTGGLAALARRRKVQVVRGTARFTGPHTVAVEGQTIAFAQAVVATGSEPFRLPFLPDDPRIMDSTGALDLADVPARLLVLGGGIIGLEMAQVYHALGSRVTVVEMTDQIIPGADRDIVAPLMARIAARYDRILLSTRVTGVTPGAEGLRVAFDGPDGPQDAVFDRVLAAVGRRPNGAEVDPGAAGVAVDDRGFIPVDRQMRTNLAHIFAIGDVVGQPMLAHKAVHEGKVAAEAACGHKTAFDARVIPAVAYTDPEVAWAGLTETQARAQGIAVRKGAFPWAASGRALSMGRDAGVTKLLFDPDTGRVLGAGICGPNAGELIAEAVLAIEMGAVAEDLSLTIHPHPTLSETLGLAAEVFEGTVTDL